MIQPTDSHSYLLYSSSHPSHVKDSIPYSQFLKLRRLCSEDSDFNSKCDEMSNFFSERGYPDSILSKALNRVQNVNRESALEPSASDNLWVVSLVLSCKLYIGESGRKLGDRFRKHLLDVKNKGSDLSKPVARHFNLPGHSHEHMEICGIYLHLGNNETRKRKEQRLIFKLRTLAPNGINERFSFA